MGPLATPATSTGYITSHISISFSFSFNCHRRLQHTQLARPRPRLGFRVHLGATVGVNLLTLRLKPT